MKFLTLLSFQAFVIALLCSSALTEERAATLDEVIKALGSLYQQKLFSVRDEGDVYEDVDLIVGGDPVEQEHPIRPMPEFRETVTVPRYHYCMKAFPYCVTFYGSIIVQNKFPEKLGMEKKNIRNTQDKLCLKNIKLGKCSGAGLMSDYAELVDVSGLEIPDFCFPGEIKLAGHVQFFNKITSDATVHVQMNPRNHTKRSNEYYEPTSCPQIGYFYKLCDLLDRFISCPNPRRDPDIYPIPCTCDIKEGVYSMVSFEKTVDKVDFFGMGERSGIAVVTTSGLSRSCFSFNFTGTLESY